MKLALVTQHFAPHFEGGTEALVRAQARVFLERGVDVRVVAGTDRSHAGDDVEAETVDGIDVRFVPRKPDEPYDLTLERPRVAALVSELVCDADLVHVHHHSTLHSSLVRDAASAERPVVMTLHDLFVTCPRFFRVAPQSTIQCGMRGEFEPCVRCVEPDAGGTPVAALRAGFTTRAFSMQAELDAAAMVCVPSEAHAERLASLVNVERLRVVPNGLVRELPRVVDEPWDGGVLRLLYLGHLAAVKGIDDLLAGIAALDAPQRARIELHCLGKAVDSELAQRLNRPGVELHGEYTADTLPECVRAIAPHLAVLPSRAYESYGLTLDEVHALGLPAWVADRGAPRERVGAAGRVLPAETPSAWTDALAQVLSLPSELERERVAVPRLLPDATASADALLAGYHALLSLSQNRP